jgi:signal peptidase II
MEAAERPGFRGKALFFLVAAVGVALDLGTKSVVIDLVRERAGPRGMVPVIEGFFYLADVNNPGGVFGMGQNLGTLLAIARGVALVVILAFVRGTPRRERLHLLCLAFLFAGALGNLVDNLFAESGSVRDWIDFYLLGSGRGHFPTFNVADSMITVGAVLLLAEGVFGRRAAPAASRGTSG